MSTGLCSESPNLEAGPGLELQGHKCRQVSRVKGTTPLQVASIFFFLHGNKEARSSVVGEVGAGGTGNLGREDKNLSSR